jgi:prevent-host-death family protein
MEIIKDYIPITKAKNDLLNLIRKLENSDDAFAITKNGTPEAVLISIRNLRDSWRPSISFLMSIP